MGLFRQYSSPVQGCQYRRSGIPLKLSSFLSVESCQRSAGRLARRRANRSLRSRLGKEVAAWWGGPPGPQTDALVGTAAGGRVMESGKDRMKVKKLTLKLASFFTVRIVRAITDARFKLGSFRPGVRWVQEPGVEAIRNSPEIGSFRKSRTAWRLARQLPRGRRSAGVCSGFERKSRTCLRTAGRCAKTN